MTRKRKLLLTAMVLAMFVLHQDCWNWDQATPLLFGCLPIGLWYHVVYTLLAAGMMWVLVKFAWPAELDGMERKNPADQHGGSGE